MMLWASVPSAALSRRWASSVFAIQLVGAERNPSVQRTYRGRRHRRVRGRAPAIKRSGRGEAWSVHPVLLAAGAKLRRLPSRQAHTDHLDDAGDEEQLKQWRTTTTLSLRRIAKPVGLARSGGTRCWTAKQPGQVALLAARKHAWSA